MPALHIVINMDGKAPRLLEGTGVDSADVKNAEINSIGCMPRGMTSGKTSIGMLVIGEDGNSYYCETSLKMLQLAVGAFTARYGDETDSETAAIFDLES